MLMKKNKNNLLLYLFLVLLFGCDFKNDVDQLITVHGNTKEKSVSYKIGYHDDKIILVQSSVINDKNKIDSTIFYKKKNGYYDKRILENEVFAKNPKAIYLLSLSIKKDTLYTYKNLLGEFFCKVAKIKDNKFTTTFAYKDSLKFKYRSTIYYNDKYKIQKIEEIYKDHKFIFISKD